MLTPFSLGIPFYPILPTQYSDALSYYEEIRLLNDEINQIIKQMDEYGEDVLSQANSYTDQSINTLNYQLRALIDTYSKQWDNEISDLADQIVQLNLNVTTLYQRFNQFGGQMDARFQMLQADLYRYVQDTVSNINRLYVLNPTNGKYEGIQKVLDDMFYSLSWGALTAQEYDNCLLEAQQYDGMRLTANEYDYWARFAMFKIIYLRMRSPFTGLPDYYDNVIYDLANLHKDSLTVQQYDALGIDADAYDDLTITAYNFDWKSRVELGG